MNDFVSRWRALDHAAIRISLLKGCLAAGMGVLSTVCQAADVGGHHAPGGDPVLVYHINYESGTIKSGFPNMETTHATAADASYVVSEARTGNYAVAHKVTLDNQGYFSDGSWRSESADLGIKVPNLFQIGQHQRYEFSILLKDWQEWRAGVGAGGDIFWQAKQASAGPSFYLMAKRNSIALRDTHPDRLTQFNLISDFRPFINKWIDFRIDVLWANDPTGYYKVYVVGPAKSASAR